MERVKLSSVLAAFWLLLTCELRLEADQIRFSSKDPLPMRNSNCTPTGVARQRDVSRIHNSLQHEPGELATGGRPNPRQRRSVRRIAPQRRAARRERAFYRIQANVRLAPTGTVWGTPFMATQRSWGVSYSRWPTRFERFRFDLHTHQPVFAADFVRSNDAEFWDQFNLDPAAHNATMRLTRV